MILLQLCPHAFVCSCTCVALVKAIRVVILSLATLTEAQLMLEVRTGLPTEQKQGDPDAVDC